MNRTEELKKIKDEVLNLKTSPLYKVRVKNKVFPVIGEGSHYAKIMLIGEAPGRNEAKTGRPFCGAAGKILDQLLASAGIERKSVYITNIVKDRPPFNRDPFPDEIAAYAPFLDRQIGILKPKIIGALGRFSMRYVMETYGLKDQAGPIGELHGKVFRTKFPYGEVTVIPLYHPAVAVYDARQIPNLKMDFKAVARALKELS
ncbi:MAG: uracil-DNA glycosylase [Patescibacteria group bacterium]|nr:uracil-DNA glycosylase [Patescibacteria group bacterium]